MESEVLNVMEIVNPVSMKCPECNFTNINEAKFCAECGSALKNTVTEIECAECNFLNPINAKFCIACGVNMKKPEALKEEKNENKQALYDIKKWLDEWSTFDIRMNFSSDVMNKAKENGKKWANISDEYYSLLWDPLKYSYDNIISYLDKDWEKYSNATEVYISVLDLCPIQDIHRQLEVGYIKCSELAVDDLTEFLTSNLFSAHSEINLMPLIADEGQKNQQKRNIQYTLKQQATEFLMLLGEVQRTQSQLQQQKTQVLRMLQESPGIFDYIKSAGFGALAVTHPLIGIPALATNVLGGYKTDKSRESILNQFIDDIYSYLKKWDELVNAYAPIANEHVEYLMSNYTTVVSGGVMSVLGYIDQQGLRVKTLREYGW